MKLQTTNFHPIVAEISDFHLFIEEQLIICDL